MSERYVAAAVQFEPRLGAKAENTARLCALVEEAAGRGARVIVTPEMGVTGYCWRDRAEIAPLVETVPGPTTATFAEIARRRACYIAVGLAERDAATNLYYNTAVLVGPEGVLASYRKSHAFISEPRWAAEDTNRPPVVDTPYGRLGLLICADADYVEPARLLGVAGCDVALFPTCWLDEKAPAPGWMARSYENGMYLVAADRYGLERGVQFSGGSCVLGPDGDVIAMRDSGDGVVYGEIDLAATQSRPFAPGGPDDKIASRRPDAYAPLALHSYLYNPLRFHRLYGEETFAHGGRFGVGVAQTGSAAGATGVMGVTDATGDTGATDVTRATDVTARVALEGLVADAVRAGAAVIALPALPLLGRTPGSAAEAARAAEGMDGPTVGWLTALARRHGAYIAGSFVERDGERLYATAVLVGPAGVVGRYRALHPTGDEGEWMTPGDLGLPVFDLPLARVGLLYGRDALYPEPARVLALGGADVILASAALSGPLPHGLSASRIPFPDARIGAADPQHFHLWRQRARENNTVVAFANRGGQDGMGASGVFGPEIGAADACVAGSASGVAVLEIDTGSTSERYPTSPLRVKEMLRQRVPAMYAPLVTE